MTFFLQSYANIKMFSVMPIKLLLNFVMGTRTKQ